GVDRPHLLAGPGHGRAAQHPGLRDRDLGRDGLRARERDRRTRARGSGEPVHGVPARPHARARLHERVWGAGVDARPHRAADRTVRPPPPADGVGVVRGFHVYVVAALAFFALGYAPQLNPYWMHVAIIAMFWAILAASWSLLAGYTGLFSLSHMAFASV